MQVIDECPVLKGHSREIDVFLAKCMTNSNYYKAKKVYVPYLPEPF